MNTTTREYILKGLFLGVWAYLALLQPDAGTFARVVGWAAGGLAVGVLAGGAFQLMRGYRPLPNPAGFALIVLLDSAFFIYIGLIGGLGLGLGLETDPPADRNWVAYCAIGGAALGFGFYQLTQIKDALYRLGVGLVVAAVGTYLAISYLQGFAPFAAVEAQQTFALQLLVGLPFFYVLTFCGEADESEVEIAALCGGLAIGLYLYRISINLPEYGDKLIFLIPLLIYFLYVTRLLPRLRVFKHTLRGYGNLSVGAIRPALASFGRALRLDPRNDLAARGLWQLHRTVDVTRLDDATLGLLNFDFCLDLATGLVIKDRPPTEKERDDATRMLDLIERQRPSLAARVDYLRAVTQTHAKQFDAAADTLGRLLDPATPYDPAVRNAVLLPAWELALRQHPEVVKRLGEAYLAKPGRRIEAIAAVERKLAVDPTDPAALELKRHLYAGLVEAEFAAAAATQPPTDFNYEYAEQLGLALVENADPAQRDRGMAYLRIAGRGLADRGPGLFHKLATLADQFGRPDEAHGYREQVKRSGLLAGPKNLPADQKQIYVATLKALSDAAAARGDYRAAIEDLRLFMEAGKEDVPTLRKLAELHAANADPLNAMLITETALLYSPKDADLLAKKDSYYYSVEPTRLAAVKEKIANWFDVAYCVRKAKQVADQKDADLDTLGYGLHLAKLARVVQPESPGARLAEARLRLRTGDRDGALQLLEDIREGKKGSGDDEDAWYAATRLLADLYLDELGRPDLAVAAYKDFLEYHKSGADTHYHLGRAYEAANDRTNALRSYAAVTAYTSHPRYYDATEAVRRLKGEA